MNSRRFIESGSIEAVDQPSFGRIAAHPENDWDGRCCRACSACRGIPADAHEHVHAAVNKFCGKCREPAIVTARPAVLEGHIFSLYIAALPQTLVKGSNHVLGIFGCACAHESNDRRRLLRTRGERPSRPSAAEQHDELAPLQLIELHLR
jgi:hypothetical protein